MRVAAALSLLLFLSSAAFASLFCYGMYHSPIFDAAPLPSVGDGFRGVNLGGWLVLEPWITPSLFYPWLCYGSVCPDDLPPVIDEASFCQRLGPAEASRRLRVHRESWVNRSTFERIAALGLNIVRLPYGHWVFGDSNDVCPGVSSIEYVDRAVEWAEATGLRLILDMHGVDAGANGMDNSGVSHKPPWARAWGRRDFDAKAWARPPHVAVTRRVLRRVAARYANRSGSVVRLGLVNEPLLSAQPLWCPAGCPMQTSELLRYYAGTWPSLGNTTVTHGANTTAGETPWGGVLDAGLGGSVGGWIEALTRHPADATAVRGSIFDMHIYQARGAWWSVPLLPTSWIPQAVHLRMAACASRESLLALEKGTGLRAMVGEWSLALTDCATWIDGVGLGSGSLTRSSPESCAYERCPTTYNAHLPGTSSVGGPTPDGSCNRHV